MPVVGIDDVVAAEHRIRALVRETPLERSAMLSARIGSEGLLKLENLQHTGSFKVRGASNKILGLDEDRNAPVVAASSGNHGAAVAYVLRNVGRKGIVFVPTNASANKVRNIRSLGAEVVFFGEDMAVTEIHARTWAAERGLTFVSPYNDAAIVAGQGTLGLEAWRQAAGRIDNVFVPVGGGGLIGGIALYLKSMKPDVRIVGCSPAASCVMAQSVRAGRILDLPSSPTLSDGTAGGIEADTITFALCRDYVDHWIEVSEEQIAEAMRLFIDAHHMLLEGAGGVAIAGALGAGDAWTAGRSMIVICGANISRSTLKSVL
ncbi:threonine/serine dehydratase [Reyranella sp.]|uniref:threonine/serine dehydratase n=2 Tax=Reyranella sp. TaxID=1929291 RepID=UPI003D0B809B